MSLPLVAIVGAPNVGKSTLFNRLAGRRLAIVTDRPGMTRDRLYADVLDAPRPFRIADTGGLSGDEGAPYSREIGQQASQALGEAAAVLFVVDARSGVTALDRELASGLRRWGKPLLVVANKVDTEALELHVHELHALGLGPPIPVSAEHALGIDALVEAIASVIAGEPPVAAAADEPTSRISVAIVGRPNVGKSSLLNRLAGEERVVVSELPGTTRDCVDVLVELEGRSYRIIDTAGLRRPGRVQELAERHSGQRTRSSIERCDVAILVLDATQELSAQDAHVAGHAAQAYRPLVVAVNKWDCVDEREAAARTWENRIRERLRFARRAPIAFVSARSGQRVAKLLALASEVHALAGIRVTTVQLNRWLQEQLAGDPTAPPPRGAFRLFYGTQTGVHPPSFLLFCNDPRRAHFSVRRQIDNSLRERFGFGSAPIRLTLRSRRD